MPLSHHLAAIIAQARALLASASYHPERHYMRGPGPKWRAKHLHISP